MKRSLATALAAALTLPAMAAGHDIRAGALHIDHPMAFATAPGTRAGGGYMTISNEGGTDDALIGVTADFPRVTLHRSVEEDGITRMEHVMRLDIPAGERVELAPGGYHVMFMGLTEPLEAGTTIPATLVFAEAGDVEVVFHVEARGDDAAGHSH